MSLVDFGVKLLEITGKMFTFSMKCLLLNASKALSPDTVGTDKIDGAVNIVGAIVAPVMLFGAGVFAFFAIPIAFVSSFIEGCILGAKGVAAENKIFNEALAIKKQQMRALEEDQSDVVLNYTSMRAALSEYDFSGADPSDAEDFSDDETAVSMMRDSETIHLLADPVSDSDSECQSRDEKSKKENSRNTFSLKL